MKQSLQINIGQHLAITPQLQQAIKLLQLSALELQAEVQEVLDSNFMLELDDDSSAPEGEAEPGAEPAPETSDAAQANDSATVTEPVNGAESLEAPEPEPRDLAANDEIPGELSVDSGWDDVYEGYQEGFSSGAGGEERDFEMQHGYETGLHEHLTQQLDLLRCSARTRAVGTAIIDAVNRDGYLGSTVEELSETLAGQGVVVSEAEVLEVLQQVQQFDPPGVAARDLRECLLSQLGQLPPTTQWRREALRLVDQYLPLLASRDHGQLRRRMDLDHDALIAVVELIRAQSPRPGGAIEPFNVQAVTPEVLVSKRDDVWHVELNPDAFPRLRINTGYSSLVKRNVNSEDNAMMRTHLQEARWFLKSLRSRNDTLLKVAKCIVEQQIAFFEQGPQAMKPMVLADIAQRVEMHESTISRVTTQKYMHTPRGTLELKYFFSSHVSTDDGGQASATSVQARIKRMVDDEDKRKPLSDAEIVKRLGADGVKVARRTVAKYRDKLSIGSSVERRMLG